MQTSNSGHYVGAFLSSLVVAASQLGALQVIHATNAWDYGSYLLGGPLGMMASMVIYRKVIKRRPPT
jgi:hypothetical protein